MLPLERLRKSNTIENLWIYILSLLTRATAKRGDERSSSTKLTRATAKRGDERSSSTKKGEIYAWEIPSLIEKKFGFKPGRITPYRVLYRLEKSGFVKSKIEERRRVYRITEKGKRELEEAEKFFQEILNKI